VYDPIKGDWFTAKDIVETLGVLPVQIPDLHALVGYHKLWLHKEPGGPGIEGLSKRNAAKSLERYPTGKWLDFCCSNRHAAVDSICH
jgi:5'-3' exonuclease